MPWYHNIVPESIKKNVCAYLLQRYLGQFFEEKLNRDQLNIDFYNGTGTVEKISLDVQVGRIITIASMFKRNSNTCCLLLNCRNYRFFIMNCNQNYTLRHFFLRISTYLNNFFRLN